MDAAADRLMLSIPSNPHYLCTIRAFFRELLHQLGFDEQGVNGVVLAVHEACANVIEHCYRGDTAQRIDLTVHVSPESLTVDIRDYGGPQKISAIRPRALQDVRPGGLGTYFMQALMDDVTYHTSDPGTLLRMTKRRSVSCKSP
jgi:anti-sigma regulatory factor (Ser/Thr protein kinase)